MIAEMQDNHLRFRTDADSPVVRGLVALLADFASGQTPTDFLATPIDPLDVLDLKRSLSPTRRHGLEAVTQAMTRFAQAQVLSASSEESSA
jgi:cysteine desulfuration protein SufE